MTNPRAELFWCLLVFASVMALMGLVAHSNLKQLAVWQAENGSYR